MCVLLYYTIKFRYSYNKTNEMHQFLKFIFGIELYRFWDSFSVHHQESSTVHTAIRICHTSYADCLLPIAVCTVLDS